MYCRTTSCHNWQHIALASAYSVVYARWCHAAYFKFYARFEHFFLALTSCQTALQISTVVEIFGHISSLTWILATSFWGASWRRCLYKNNPLNWRWQECLLSCAEGLRKICVATLLQMYCRLQEVTQRNGGHMKHILTKRSLHRCRAICKKLVVEKRPIHFL